VRIFDAASSDVMLTSHRRVHATVCDI